jgi:hypothetical protein
VAFLGGAVTSLKANIFCPRPECRSVSSDSGTVRRIRFLLGNESAEFY